MWGHIATLLTCSRGLNCRFLSAATLKCHNTGTGHYNPVCPIISYKGSICRCAFR